MITKIGILYATRFFASNNITYSKTFRKAWLLSIISARVSKAALKD
jgi:hypothetical protein